MRVNLYNFTRFLILFCAVQVNAYEIKVCKIPLTKVLFRMPEHIKASPGIANLFHLYVENSTGRTLNFDPAQSDLSVVFGAPKAAVISNRSWAEAECQSVYSTESKALHDTKWAEIKNTYEESLNAGYQLYNIDGKNCGKVAKEAVEKAGLLFPWPNINAQNNTAFILRALGNLHEAENYKTFLDESLNAISALFPVTQELAGQIGNFANNIQGQVEKDNCAIQ